MVQSNHMELAWIRSTPKPDTTPPCRGANESKLESTIQVVLYIVLAEKHTHIYMYMYINKYNQLILHIIFTVMCAAQSPEFFRPEIQVSMIQVILFLLVGNSQR